jgi:hypothetical protein
MPVMLNDDVVWAAVLVPEIDTDNVSVPVPPIRLSPGFSVVPFATVPFAPTTAENVSSPAEPVKAAPMSALVVSDLWQVRILSI